MRLLFLTENYPPNMGGMAQSCDRIVNNLRENGVPIDVVHFTNRNKPFVCVEQLGGQYSAVPKHKDSAHSLNVALSYIEHHLDLNVYAGMIVFGGTLPLLAAPIYAKLLGLSYYLCLRGNDFDISVFDAKRRSALIEAVAESIGVFVGSRDKQARLSKLFPNSRVHYSPSGIDLSRWQAVNSEAQFAAHWRQGNVAEHARVIGMLGYLKTKKGVRFFLQALVLSGMTQKVHLLLSGEQPEETLEFMRSREISFSIIPFIERYELIKYYLACDWVAIPSYYEGMPNAMLEAGGLAVPVLATRVDGMRDMIEHSVTGLLFRPVDVADCAKQIAAAVGMDSGRRTEMGKLFQQHIASLYRPQDEVAAYLDVINAELEGNRCAVAVGSAE